MRAVGTLLDWTTERGRERERKREEERERKVWAGCVGECVQV